MSSSVGAEVFRFEDWECGAAGRAEAAAQRPQGSDRTPPWPRRRLHDALAELGPVRPTPPLPEDPRGDERGAVDRCAAVSSGLVAETATAPAAAALAFEVGEEPAAAAAPARSELPPPPRPVRPPADDAAEMVDALVAAAIVLPWEEAALADGDRTGADIVRALAAANLPAPFPPAPAPPPPAPILPMRPMADSPLHHDDPLERPPMIIERALAQQGLGLLATAPVTGRGSPWPGLTVGFGLALLVGAALYFVRVIA
jgi:hypothetical protein